MVARRSIATLLPLCKAMHEVRAQYLVLLLRNFSPWVLQDLLCSWASFRRFVKKLGEEESCGRRHVVRELKILRPDVIIQLLVVLTSEGELTAEQSK